VKDNNSPALLSGLKICLVQRSSADEVMRMRLSKQRNKHIQRVLVEAAKLVPRLSPELALGP
jgi:transposase